MTQISNQDFTNLHAWQRFSELVDRGAGARDVVSAQAEFAISPRQRAYVLDLVEHHRINSVPFLVDREGLAGGSIIEIGAGTAGLSVALVQAGVGRVAAVEPIRENHEGGVWRVRAHGLEERITCHHVPNPQRLPFPDGSFDAAVASSVLQYVPSPDERRALLREMHRVVRRGGLVIVSGSGNALFPVGPHATSWWSNWLPRLAARRGHNRGVSLWEVRRALEPLGAIVDDPRPGAFAGAIRWHRRRLHRGPRGLGLVGQYLLFAGYAACEATLCRALGVPVEAFMPYLAVAFRKTL